MKNQKILFGLLFIISLLMIGCENSKEVFNPTGLETIPSPAGEDQSASSDNLASATGAVYTMTNDPTDNEIVAFHRNANGALKLIGYFSTKGAGTGGQINPLGSQGSIALGSSDIGSARRYLFAVNAGSNEISSFEVQSGRLDIRDKVHSGGEFPISLTVHGNLLYALNAKGANEFSSGNITGFRFDRNGQLKRIPQSSRPVSERDGTAPAQVQFSPNGRLLVVTDKAINAINVFTVDNDGLTKGPIVHRSVGETPFGFAFDRKGQLIVSEAFGGNENASATSLYEVGQSGELQVISPSVRTNQTAGCWTVVTNDGRYAYVSNTLSHTISGFAIDEGGLRLINDTSAQTGAESYPIDMALSQDSRYLYVLNAGQGTIGAYQIGEDGGLTSIVKVDKAGVLPAFSGIQGLAAY